MRSPEIRRTFLDFFSDRGHRRAPAASLIPANPGLLLTNAGMNQFVPFFTGDAEPPFPRLTTAQKCARTVDIDNVGLTCRHATGFEMLGNFSFGDYYKDEVIAWAFELLTEGFGLDVDRLWVTVHQDDDEAIGIWRRLGFPAERIQRLGMADNYWSTGMPGPCGPSSEIFWDRGPEFGPEGGPALSGERYLELWNLVFMQNLRGEGGTGPEKKEGYPILGPLPRRHIDTGLGLERLAMVLQDVHNPNLTDRMRPVLAEVEEVSGRGYPSGTGPLDRDPVKTSLQVVADHSRTAAQLVADGVLPSTEGRGYVLRRLLRRAVRHGRLLGVDEPFLHRVTGRVVEVLGGQLPELAEQAPEIERVVRGEEEAFRRTLARGTRALETAVRRSDGRRLSGAAVFELYDTYGFPPEMTEEAAGEAGLGIDREGFAELLGEQRRRAREGGLRSPGGTARYRELLHRRPGAASGEFTGYERLEDTGAVVAVLPGNDGPGSCEVVLDRSPFYARRGGQVGDTGVLVTGDGMRLPVTDTVYGVGELRVHRVASGPEALRPGDAVTASVDAERRRALARAHSATHVLHAVVREVLGPQAVQRGSLVEPDRLRFDFVHSGAVGPELLAEIERRVNERVLDDPEVRAWYGTRREAEEAGALALFGETYGATVRVVDIGGFSRELCGGTHVGHGSQVGGFRLLGEESVGTGVRRVEALTGREAARRERSDRGVLAELSGRLGTRPSAVLAQLDRRLAELAELRGEVEALRERERSSRAERLVPHARRVPGGRVLAARVSDVDAAGLRALALDLQERIDRISRGEAIVVLAAESDGKALLVAARGDGEARGLLQRAGGLVGGGAGGKGRVANAGGRRTGRLEEALSAASVDAERALEG